MNAAPLEPARWSPRRWLYTIAAVFLAQVVLIFLLAEPPHRLRRPPHFRTAISLAADAWSEQQLAELPALAEPTLFALPSLHGFSSAAWLTFAPMEHRFADWTNSAHWLELEPATLGKALPVFVSTNVTAPLLIADEPLPSLPGPGSRLTNAPVAARSELRIEGDLARRPLLAPLVLPPWPHSDLLTNTVVQLLVDADGDTLPVTLLSSCGTNTADQFAMKIAASARFQPLDQKRQSPVPPTQITWGKMIFQWHTVPLAATNTVTTRP